MIELDTIYNENYLTGMQRIPDGSVDLVATDPPYRLTTRGSSGTMSGYWVTDAARKGFVFDHNDITIEEYLPELIRPPMPFGKRSVKLNYSPKINKNKTLCKQTEN